MWNYINHPDVLTRINTVRENLFAEALVLAERVPGFENLPEILKEVNTDWYRVAAFGTRNWVATELMLISLRYLGSTDPKAQVVETTVQLLKSQMHDIVVPAFNKLKI